MGTATKGRLIQILCGTAAATATVTWSGDSADLETLTVGSRVYEFDEDVTPTITAGRVRVDITGGKTAAASATAFIAAVNSDTGSPVTAATGGAGVAVLTAKTKGTGGNSIAKAESTSNATWDVGGGGTLFSGGADTLIALQRGGSITFTTDMIDVTTKDDALWKQFLPGHSEGEITCDGLLDITDTAQASMQDAEADGTPLTVIFGLDGASPTDFFTSTGYVSNWKANGAHDGVMDYSATFKVTGVCALTV